MGLWAAVLCLTGYAAGLVWVDRRRPVWVWLVLVAATSAGAVLGYAVVSALVGDPRVAQANVPGLVMGTVLYDLLLTPFVVPGVAALARRLIQPPRCPDRTDRSRGRAQGCLAREPRQVWGRRTSRADHSTSTDEHAVRNFRPRTNQEQRVSDRSRLRLFVIQVLVLSLLATLVGPALVPAGHGRRPLLAGRRGQPGPRGRHPRRSRPDPRRHGPSAGEEPHDHGGLGRHQHSRPSRPTAVPPCCTGWPRVLHKPYHQIAQRLKPCGTPGAPAPPVCWNGSPYQPIPVAENTSPPRRAADHASGTRRSPASARTCRPLRDLPRAVRGAAPRTCSATSVRSPTPSCRHSRRTASSAARSQLQRTDLVGRDGLEAEYDSWLRGKPGITKLAVDHTGAVVGTLSETNPQPGDYLVTSINAKLQAVVEQQLKAAIARARSQTDPNGVPYKAEQRRGVVLDATNGRCSPWRASRTTTRRSGSNGITQKQYKQSDRPRRPAPRCSPGRSQGQFAPASTFKIVSTSAAVQAGYPLNGYYPCPSSFTVGNADLDQLRERVRHRADLVRQGARRSPATPSTTRSPTTCG